MADSKTEPQFAAHPVTTPPAVYNGAPQMPMHTVVHASPVASLGVLPALIDCPFCRQRTQTRIVEEHSSMTM
jgi:hypothetical protein